MPLDWCDPTFSGTGSGNCLILIEVHSSTNFEKSREVSSIVQANEKPVFSLRHDSGKGIVCETMPNSGGPRLTSKPSKNQLSLCGIPFFWGLRIEVSYVTCMLFISFLCGFNISRQFGWNAELNNCSRSF